MAFVTSKDGTRIGYSQIGRGPAVIIVDGALCYRSFGPATPLAQTLAKDFTVITYDRRGRGESGDTQPYAVRRECEDLEALIAAAGGRASLFGISSGAALTLEAAANVRGVEQIALYEAPFMVDPNPERDADAAWRQINDAVRANKRGAALTGFFRLVGVPTPFIWLMRLMPMFRKLKAVAHTLPYDGALVRDNQRGRPLDARAWRGIAVPALVFDGGKSPAWMRNGMRAFADTLPNSTYQTVPGQTHMVHANVHGPVVAEFFKRAIKAPASSARAALPEPAS